jgi:hypothetical protein
VQRARDEGRPIDPALERARRLAAVVTAIEVALLALVLVVSLRL